MSPFIYKHYDLISLIAPLPPSIYSPSLPLHLPYSSSTSFTPLPSPLLLVPLLLPPLPCLLPSPPLSVSSLPLLLPSLSPSSAPHPSPLPSLASLLFRLLLHIHTTSLLPTHIPPPPS